MSIGAETVFVNGRIITADRDFSVASAMAINLGQVTAVGNDDDVRQLVGPQTKTVSLNGRCILPGQVDAYTHFIYSGVDLLGERGKVNIIRLQSIDEILSAIKQRVEHTPAGKWIGTSCMYRGALKEGRFPTRHDLDRVAPNNPVYVLQGGRPIIANTMALRLAQIDRSTPNPTSPAGTIVRDDTDEPTGQLVAGAADLARKEWSRQIGESPEQWDLALFDQQTLIDAIAAQQSVYHACGITAVRDEGTTRREVSALIEAHSRGLLQIRTGMLVAIPERYLDEAERAAVVDSYFSPWELGDDILWLAGVSLVYSLEGWFMVDEPSLGFFITEGVRRGWRLAVTPSTGGGRAPVDAVLTALERAAREEPISNRRFALLHPMALRNAADIERARALGLTLNPNPLLGYYAAARSLKMHALVSATGLHRDVDSDAVAQTARMWGMPLKTWLRSGMVVSAGSNSPAAVHDVDHPFLGMYTALTGDTLAGVLLPDEELSRDQAIRLHTTSAAFALSREGRFGSLETGKLADFTVVDQDVATCTPRELRNTKVLQTYIGGRLVYERE